MAKKVEVVILAKDQASAVINKIGGGIRSFAGITLAASGVAVGAIGAIGAAMFGLARDAAPIELIAQAFDAFAASAGTASAALLEDLQEASAGLITNRDLMEKYNLATQLVSADFAEQLPEAMQYLAKVAASTGQDMGYMLDSLVRGVGRLSPMILDNLAIQVDMEAAYQTYADSIGKSTDELTKAEQQTAIMNEVLILLEKNTAALPDITGSAAQSFGSLTTNLKNAKDELGLALIPLFAPAVAGLSSMVGALVPLIRYLGMAGTEGDALNDWLTHLPEAWQGPALAIGTFISNLKTGIEEAGGLKEFLIGLIPPEIITGLEAIGTGFGNLLTAFQEDGPLIQEEGDKLATWFKENFLPTFALIFEQIGGILDQLAVLWDQHGETIIASVSWLIKFITTTLVGGLSFILGLVQGILALLSGDFSGAWAAIQTATENFANMVLSLIGTSVEEVRAIWAKNLEMLITIAGLLFLRAWGKVQEFVGNVKSAFAGIGEAISKVLGWIGNLADAFFELILPDWLTPGSPTPFEIGLRGINKELSQLGSMNLPKVETGFAGLPGSGFSPTPALSGAGGGSPIYVSFNYSPGVSFADQNEIETRLLPLLENTIRQVVDRRGR